ncbi:MAG: endo-inulinase [Planctomycetota bacterium]|nr:MAG: endo-inulinase [Planctomycetota bacterium]
MRSWRNDPPGSKGAALREASPTPNSHGKRRRPGERTRRRSRLPQVFAAIRLLQVLLALVIVLAGDAPSACRAAPDFDRDIRPILSDKCFHCHGPDAETREADLRLDVRDSALGRAIVPGKPDDGELIARIASTDESSRMPPVETGLSLTDREKQLLRDWIAAGAEYAEHWSFRPLRRAAEVPAVGDPSWPRQPFDWFILARLEAEGLQPAPRADALRLLRRMALDLTGLPPTVAEIEAFEAAFKEDADAALAAAADRLLASDAFGEHLAVAWLDAARYADSFGYQSDQLNTQWPYRDWVVRAFNQNLPYDEFLTWQLAGDLLPGATRDQVLATAFNRMHRLTNEGGSIAEEWLAENAADRVQTFGAAMLGLTLECARCHDHKYDPILTRDYYSLTAFFNSIAESGMYDHSAKVPPPSLLLPTAEQEARLAAAREEVAAAEAAVAKARAGGQSRFAAWRESPPAAELADLVAHYTFDGELSPLRNEAPGATTSGDAAGLAQVAGVPGLPSRGRPGGRDSFATGDPASNANSPVAKDSRTLPDSLNSNMALRFDGDHGASFPALLEIDRFDPFTIDFWLRDHAASPLPVVVAHRTFGTDVGPNGFDLMLAGGVLQARLYRVWPGNAIGVEAAEPLAAGQWTYVAVSYDGSSRATGFRLYIDGRPLALRVLRDHIYKRAAVATYGEGSFTLGQRFRDRGFKDGEIDDFRAFSRALTPLEVRRLHDATAGDSQPEQPSAPLSDDALFETYLSAVDQPYRQALAQLQAAGKMLLAVEEEIQEVSVMQDDAEPRPTYVLARGAYDAPKTDANRVLRDVFQQVLPPFPADAPRNRLGLAGWLTAPQHPLTARVAVNRLWANFFGRGLVATPENFGRQGAAPTHPELLDWLARDFIDHGWDVKRLCRRIVLSATYQQDSRAPAELRDRDPDNALLARGPSRRLSAEQIRDLALAASGLLHREIGGPPVSPYQPGGDLWREANSMSPPYKQSAGTALHRRSLYSVWKRTAPLPNMMVFDATTREVCTMARSRTSTPLQALVLLNDVQFVEAAEALAAAAGSTHGDEAKRIEHCFLALTARRPTRNELTLLTDLYGDQRQRFAGGEQAPAELLALGQATIESSLRPADLAALTVVCQAILNLDATIHLR